MLHKNTLITPVAQPKRHQHTSQMTALFRHIDNFMVNRQGFRVITNVSAGIALLLVSHLNVDNLAPIYHEGNIPVLIAGAFPLFASFAMFIGVMIAPPMALLRVAYIAGMFIAIGLGV